MGHPCWIPIGKLALLLYNCAVFCSAVLYMVLLQLKNPLELFVKRREFLSSSEILLRLDMALKLLKAV